jgi:hypothetical protein
VLCATWNVNAKKLDDASSDLSSWLFPDDGSPPPAVVAVGFQEIVDLNAVNVAVDSKASQRSSLWQETISRTLKTRGSYTLLASVHLVGMLLCVYVSAPHVAGVSNIHTSTAGVGVMGVLGNKGGVSVRFQLNDSTFCFVCAHFAAHRENVAGRNADFQSIVAKTAFEVGEEAVREGVKSGSLEQWSEGSTSIGLMDHDFVYVRCMCERALGQQCEREGIYGRGGDRAAARRFRPLLPPTPTERELWGPRAKGSMGGGATERQPDDSARFCRERAATAAAAAAAAAAATPHLFARASPAPPPARDSARFSSRRPPQTPPATRFRRRRAFGPLARARPDPSFARRYWLGDLNYRIDEALATDDVLRMAAAGEVEELRAHDQLNIERFNERVFQGFEEGVIDFGPTYK